MTGSLPLPQLSSAFRRWVCCLLAVLLPAQAGVMLAHRAQGQAHRHVAIAAAAPGLASIERDWKTSAAAPVERVIAALRKGHGSLQKSSRWPVEHGARTPHAVQAAPGHAHDAGTRHHHPVNDATVVPQEPAEEAGSTSTLLAGGGIWAPPSEPVSLPVSRSHVFNLAVPHLWTTRHGATPDKPPRTA